MVQKGVAPFLSHSPTSPYTLVPLGTLGFLALVLALGVGSLGASSVSHAATGSNGTWAQPLGGGSSSTGSTPAASSFTTVEWYIVLGMIVLIIVIFVVMVKILAAPEFSKVEEQAPLPSVPKP